MMVESLIDTVAECEAARRSLDDPLERLLDAVADDDQYEVDSLIRECVDAVTELGDACDGLAAACTRNRSATRWDAVLVQKELVSLGRELKSIGRSGAEGDELQDLMDAWNDSFEDCDESLNDLLSAFNKTDA